MFKKILFVLIFSSACFPQFSSCILSTSDMRTKCPEDVITAPYINEAKTYTQTGALIKAEKLTDEEKDKLSKAQEEVYKAKQALTTAEYKIAKDHNFAQDTWTAWYGDWYEFDGDFILLRHNTMLNLGVVSPAITW